MFTLEGKRQNMFKLLFQRNDDFDYYVLSKHIRFYGAFGAVMHLVFFIICEYIFGYKDSYILRGLLSVAYLIFLTYKTTNWTFLQKQYYDFILVISLPIFFGYMMLLNRVNTYWAVVYLFGILIFIIFCRARIVLITQLITVICSPLLLKVVVDYNEKELLTLFGIIMVSLLLTFIILILKGVLVKEIYQNKQLRESIGNQNDLLTSLIYISGELSMYDSIEAVFEVLVDRFGALLPNYAIGLYLSSGESKRIKRSETKGLTESQLNYIEENFSQLTQNATSVINGKFIEIKENWNIFNKEYSILNHSGDIEYNLMMLLVGDKIADYQIGFIQMFMEQVSGNIRMRELAKQLDLFSKTDQLTLLYNRNAYNQEIKYLIKNYQEKHPFSIVFGDVNGLKFINDTYGHTDGDALLRRCSELIIEALPVECKVFRYGGDEVVIILEDTGLEEAMRIEQVLEDKFKNQKLLCTSEVTGEQVNEDVAMSFGAICSREGSFEELIDLADVRMRKNKAAYYMEQQREKYR